MPLDALFERITTAANTASRPTSPAPMRGGSTRIEKRRRSSSNASLESRSGSDAELVNNEGENEDLPSQLLLEATPRRIINRNTLDHVRRIGRHKRLRADKQKELEEFVSDSQPVQLARIFASVLAVQQTIEKYEKAKAPYSVPKSLRTNIASNALGTLLSTEVTTYKGDAIHNHVLRILKAKQFDTLPENKNDDAAWAQVTSTVKETLTEQRRRLKKIIGSSVESTDTSKHDSIYKLTEKLCKSSKCKPSVPLCARVALMRAVYMEDHSERGFWNSVDKSLEKIRETSDGNPRSVVRTFRSILDEDRELHGNVVEDTNLAEDVDEWQTEINNIVAAS